MKTKIQTSALALVVIIVAFPTLITAQPAAQPPRNRGSQGPQVVSPELASDRHITFRILATKAERVKLAAGDIPGNGPGAEMVKGTNGVWEVTLGPIDSGAYRYNFNVDGVSVIDPRNPATSESNNNVWSVVYVPGSDFMDTKQVPHGTVGKVTYYSKTLQRFRSLHIYTPPGYELGHGRFPVFYLLHGAGDSDDSWTSVGRAGVIMDNLIADGKAKPMVGVMPARHTRAFSFGGGGRQSTDEFVHNFVDDIMPRVEKSCQ